MYYSQRTLLVMERRINKMNLKERVRKVVSLLLLFAFIVTGTSGYSVSAQTSNIKSMATDPKMVSIVSGGKAAAIYIDQKGEDYDGLSIIAKSFAEDVNLVTGILPEVVTDSSKLSDIAIIAGSIGNNAVIDNLISTGKLDVSSINGKWECYKIQVVNNPVSGVNKAIVVVGSDKRGTIYGIYHISEMIGVSPWVYWGDVIPKKQSELTFSDEELNLTSKEPSVKYRGIFLNDEAPSLSSWVKNKFGDYNENFYNKVFELILRLKGNYLWPAMWSNNFSEDGKSNKFANAESADAYGIVMGTSHHEPMCRAGVEWQRIYKNYSNSNAWDFAKNKEAITKFWDDGIKRNQKFENLITLGMRGENDSSLKGTDQENINNLKNVITTQKDILKKYGLEKNPQVLTLYKEVEKFWYGTAQTPGLNTWDVLDDVTIMLAEDNYTNVRTLPSKDEKDREAGWGMYYHVDYNGAPRGYMWVNTVPISKIWEQMSMAYDYGVDRIWIVNVGDLKPMELPASYFLDLAYDFDKWGTDGINKTEEYTRQWVKQQFGSVADDSTITGIAKVLSDYTALNDRRRPESIAFNTYSFINYNEGQRVLAQVSDLEKRAQLYYDKLPAEYKDAYYQLVYYPAVASANVHKMQIYTGLNKFYTIYGSALTNTYAKLAIKAIDTDKQMQNYYNNTMSGGKWRGMMSQVHVGYKSWDIKGAAYPTVYEIQLDKSASMLVNVQGSQAFYNSGAVDLPVFTSTEKETYTVSISNAGTKKFAYKVKTSADWIKVSSKKGNVTDGVTLKVSIDWSKVPKTKSGVITITGAKYEVEVNVSAKVINTKDFPKYTFVEAHDVVSINAEHFANKVAKSNVEWKVIENYGKYTAGLKMYPTTVSFNNIADAPYIEYSVYVDEDSDYTLTTYTAPTNKVSPTSKLRYAVAFDKETPQTVDTHPSNYVAGEWSSPSWSKGVMDNIHIMTTTHKLKKGLHTLRFYGVDAAIVLEKLVLSNKPIEYSYFGPEESYYVGK